MIPFEDYFQMLCEMARPASSFSDPKMNQAYAECLKKFQLHGMPNAGTFNAWNFMYRLLPEFFQEPRFLNEKARKSGNLLKSWMLELFQQYRTTIDFNQLAVDIVDDQKIIDYIQRPDRGNRSMGKQNAQIPYE